MTPMKAALTEKVPLPSVTMTERKASVWKNAASTALTKTIVTGTAASMSTVSATLTKTIMAGTITSMSTVSAVLTKTIMTGTITSTSTVSAALTKTKAPAGADPAAVTMTGAKEDQPFRSRKMPDSDDGLIHFYRLIS